MDRWVGKVRSRAGLFAVAIVAACAVGVGTAAGLFLAQDDASSAQESLKTAPLPPSTGATTLAEAFARARQAAAGWAGHWVLTDITSTDVEDTASVDNGLDGRRRSWNARFVDDAGTVRLMLLVNGQVARSADATKPSSPRAASPVPPDLPGPTVDSPQALRVALQAEPALKGATDPTAMGIGFEYDRDQVSGAPTLVVVGEANGLPTRLVLDPATGDLAAHASQHWSGGELYVSSDAGVTWRHVTMPGPLRAETSAGDGRVFAIVLLRGAPAVMTSGDYGASWSKLTDLSLGPGRWVYDIALARNGAREELFVASQDGAWWVDPVSGSAVQADGPDGPGRDVLISLMVDDAGLLHAIVSSAPGPENAHHYRWDGRAWAIVDTAAAVALGRSDAAVVGLPPGPAFLPNVPQPVLALAGSGLGRPQYAITADSLWRESTPQAGWAVIQRLPLAAVGVSPSGGTVLAGAFLTSSVMRSTDAGTTFRSVLALNGRAHILAFFDEYHALVATTIEGSWE